jgi:hypothetical protein
MIRQPEREQIHRLTVKTLDQVFIARVRLGLHRAQYKMNPLGSQLPNVTCPPLPITSSRSR